MMTSPPRSVFISYRRNVSSFLARAVYMDLRAHNYDVFMDVQSIDSGKFSDIILRQIVARGNFVLICTPGTFDRCSESGDWLRRETEHALDNRRNIVPLHANDFRIEGAKSHLTGKLEEIQWLNALNVPHEYFDEAMERLRTRFLKDSIDGRNITPPLSDASVVEAKQALAASQIPPTKQQLRAEAYFSRAFTRSKTDYEAQIRDFTDSILLNPTLGEAYSGRGLAYLQLGSLEKAFADLEVALRLDPENGMTYYHRGVAHYKKGDLQAALVDFTQSVRLDPTFAESYSYRGAILRKMGEADQAILDYDEALQLDPSNADAFDRRAYAKLQKLDLEGALFDVNQAIALQPDFASSYDTRAEIYFKQHNYADAVNDYERFRDLGGAEKAGRTGEIEGRIRDLKRKLEK